MSDITRFILFIGPCSSVFDYTTYFMMLYLFDCWDPSRASLFQTGWFVESLLTQTLIIHVIRTNKIPFVESRASWPLIFTSLMIVSVGAWSQGHPGVWMESRSNSSAHRWGDVAADPTKLASLNPINLVSALQGMPLYISHGNGEPGPLDPPTKEYDSLEAWVGEGDDRPARAPRRSS
jgi:hypothetical protein